MVCVPEEKLLAEVNKKGGVSDLENNPAWQVVVAQKKAPVTQEQGEDLQGQ